MTATFTLPAAQVAEIVRHIMENFPEASNGCALRCVAWKYDTMKFIFWDDEENKEHEVDESKLVAAFPLIFSDKWPKGCTQPPASTTPEAWDDWLCQSDAQDDDAFIQLAIFGEVIYG